MNLPTKPFDGIYNKLTLFHVLSFVIYDIQSPVNYERWVQEYFVSVDLVRVTSSQHFESFAPFCFFDCLNKDTICDLCISHNKSVAMKA